jgi:hypothetical protein
MERSKLRTRIILIFHFGKIIIFYWNLVVEEGHPTPGGGILRTNPRRFLARLVGIFNQQNYHDGVKHK